MSVTGVSPSEAELSQEPVTVPAGVVLYFLVPYLIPVIVVAGALLGGYYNLLTPFAVFGVVPLLDIWVGRDPNNPPESSVKALGELKFFRYVLFAYVPVQTALLFWGAWHFSTQTSGGLEQLLFTLSMGILTGGLGITFAHELGHKANRLEQNLSKILLVEVCYGHFFIEHNNGHHTHVSTHRDPATSRFGESFYRFYPRTVVGSFMSAWAIEQRRLQKAGRAKWGIHNQMLWFVGLSLLTAALLSVALGPQVLLYFFGQSWIAFSLLEIVNYLEHYGLERRELSPGKYERVNALHSWNSNHRLTNGFLIMLQRHSDHHANPQRRYQTLRHFEESPQLPTGYAGMVLLALLPPLWFRVMNPRVLEFRRRLAERAA